MSTTTVPVPVSHTNDIPTEPIWRLSVDDYHAMIEAGILQAGDPVEFLEGWLVKKMTKPPSHVTATRKTRRILDRNVPSGWFAESQDPLTTDDSEPEPDVSVIRGEVEDYGDHHPGPQDIGLLVEVADTSLERDRGWKKRLYAAAGIPLYWILNLNDRQVEVFGQPSGAAETADYALRQVFSVGESVPVILDGDEVARVAVADLLP